MTLAHARLDWAAFRVLVSGVVALATSVSLGAGKPQGPSGAKSSSVLPRGSVLPQEGVSGPDKEQTREETLPDCLETLANPPGVTGQFSRDGKSLVLLTARLNGGATLYRLNLVTLKADPLFSVKIRSGSSLMAVGEPVQGVTAIQFAPGEVVCGHGAANLVSLSFANAAAKKGSAAVSSKGKFALLHGPDGILLADLEKEVVLETDALSLQTRTAMKIPTGERPAFFDPGDKRLMTWKTDPRTLSLYRPGLKTPEQTLALAPTDRVVIAGGRVLVASVSGGDNKIELRELKAWSGVPKDSKFLVALPKAYAASEAAFRVHAGKRLLLVQGATAALREHWQKAFLIQYDTGKIIATVPVKGPQFVEYGGIDPTGTRAVFEMRDLAKHTTLGLKVFTFATGKFQDVALEKL